MERNVRTILVSTSVSAPAVGENELIFSSIDCPRKSSCSCQNKSYHASKPALGEGKLKPCCEKQIRLTYNRSTKQFKLNPVMVHLHGIEIPVYSVHCALAAVLTITLMPPTLDSKKIHDHAYCLASLLGKWCFIIGDKDLTYFPAMVFVMCGTSSSSSNPKILWSCGTSKPMILRALDQYQRKIDKHSERLVESWRVDRQNMVDIAIGVSFNEEELPESQPPRSKKAMEKFLRTVTEKNREDAEGIQRIYSENVELPEEKPVDTIWKFGDCAESMPLALVANTCQGYAIAIALRPETIYKSVKSISGSDEILPRDSIKSEQSCQVCQWSFAGLQHKRKIEVHDMFEKLELNVNTSQRLA